MNKQINEPSASDRLRFGFVPFDQGDNEYCARMCDILGQLGSVQAIPRATLASLFDALRHPPRLDAAFVSWYENQMLDRAGQISLAKSCKVLLRTLALRAHARKLILIRHNRVPHATIARHRPLAQRLVDLYEKCLFDSSVTHSPVETSDTRLYCPHPLYPLEAAPPPSSMPLSASGPERFFVAFGRIEPYKQLEELIRVFPHDARLVICGRCSDEHYLATLLRAAPENVSILHGFMPDAAAQDLIRRSYGVVISHASDDMIVSGSFFYAMSLAQRVYAVETPFLRWASAALGSDTVVVSPDLGELCQSMANAAPRLAPPRQLHAIIQQHFADDTIARHIRDLLARLDLHVRSVESYSEAMSQAVCSSRRGDGALRS